MQSDTFFSATIVTVLAAVGAAAVMTVGAPAGRAAVQRQHVARAPAAEARLPAVLVIGKRETRVAAGDAAASPSRLQ